MRAIAVIAVFLYHADLTWARGGYLGVDLFFVISGFLITGLLVTEVERTGRLSLGQFYLRRARRLLPASWLMMVAVVITAAFLAPDALPRLRYDAFAAFFYVTNWELLAAGKSYFEAIGRQPLLLHLWSLAIEEQFYILWAPIILVFATRLRGRLLLAIASLLAAGSVAWMAWSAARMDYPDQGDPTRLYFGTDTHGFSLLLGAVLGLLWRPDRLQLAAGLPGGEIAFAIGMAALILTFALFLYLDESTDWLYPWGFLVCVAASAILIAAATFPGSGFGHFLDREPMRWIGERSYGLYLWHWPIFMMTRPSIDLHLPAMTVLAIRISLTVLIAALSYSLVETPVRRGAVGQFLSRARHADFWRSAPRAAHAVLIVLVTGTAAGWAVTVLINAPKETTASRDVIEAIGPARSTVAVRAAHKPRVVTPHVAMKTARQQPRKEAVETFTGDDLTAIGDSVLLGTTRQLNRQLPGAQVYATVGWQAADVLRQIQSLHDDDDLTPVVLIHTGTNGYVKEKQLRKMLSLLADRDRVLIVNTHVPRRWMDANNAMIDRVVPDYPNAIIVDWRTLSEDQPHYFVSDGVHLTISGQKALVAEIVQVGHFAVGPSKPAEKVASATPEVATIADDREDDAEMAVSYPPLMPSLSVIEKASAVAFALLVAPPAPPAAGAATPASFNTGPGVPDLVCPQRPPRTKATGAEEQGSIPGPALLGTLGRAVTHEPPTLSESQIPEFDLRDPTTSAPRPRSFAFWGDSHIAAGPLTTEIAQSIRDQNETVGMRFLPPTMGRTNVRLPIRGYCIGQAWTSNLAYKSGRPVDTGPALAVRSASAGTGSYLWLDLRNAEREPTLRQVELVYRPGAQTTLAISLNDAPEQQFALETRPAGSAPSSEVLKLTSTALISTVKLRVEQGHLDLLGFVLDYDAPPTVTLDIFGVPSSEIKGWANANPEYLSHALHGVSYDAFVLEYGTNEGNDPHFSPESYAVELRSALTNVRSVLPRASCLLVSPPDRGVLVASGSANAASFDFLRFAHIHQQIAAIQAKVGAEFGCAAWNWQDAMGGPGGSYGWANNTPPFMSRDLTHLTPEGYGRTAQMLVKSLGWTEPLKGEGPVHLPPSNGR